MCMSASLKMSEERNWQVRDIFDFDGYWARLSGAWVALEYGTKDAGEEKIDRRQIDGSPWT